MASKISLDRLDSVSIRASSLSSASNKDYDVLIIGGGIVGTGIARDASMRGLSVILFERQDLSFGTSSKSSRLIHGGLRYLETYDFALVSKDLHERETLLHIAPHLVRPLKFIVPNYDASSFQRVRLRIGMILYDLLSMGKTLPSHQMLSAEQVIESEPSLKREGLQGGALFYDCQSSFVERLSIENALSAVEKGAKVFTYTSVIGLESGKSGFRNVTVENVLSKEKYSIQARFVVNATGPWSDKTLQLLGKGDTIPRLRTTKGIHIVVPRVSNNAVILYSKSDSRLFFVIPWLNNSLIGTTDTDYDDDPANAHPDSSDIRYLLKETAVSIPSVMTNKILFTYAGIRPLVRSTPQKKESDVSRNYSIIDHSSKNEQGGLISVLGVKITAYRQASEDATDLLCRKLKINRKCSTDTDPLPGGRGISDFKDVTIYSNKLRKYELDEEQITYLMGIYGSRIAELADLMENDKTLVNRICPNNPDVEAEIVLAVNSEHALSVSDFMMRRAPIVFSACRGLDCVENVAHSMGRILKWSDREIQTETESYKAEVDSRFPPSPTPMRAND